LRFAVDFLAAGLRAAVFLFAVLFLAAMLPPSLLGLGLTRWWCHDAMRFRRRRSRSLMPPHTP
jgi:hypothetical protein